jgi:hypothetical protein
MVFAIHVLEYRSLILEQISESRDRVYLSSLESDESRTAAVHIPEYVDGVATTEESEPWINMCGTMVIRDLGAVGFRHLGTTGQNIIRTVVTVSSDNYPELLRKCYMVNTPWVFTSIWYIIKGWVAAKTVAKVSLLGGSFMEELLEEVDEENIPVLIGGKSTVNDSAVYEAYPFDKEYFKDPSYKPEEKLETVFTGTPIEDKSS